MAGFSGTNLTGDPVPAISEAEATGDIAALYTNIRSTLGVPVVNLIWRHLAVFPGGLDWAWTALKPLYANGAIVAQAFALRAGLDVPALPGLSGPALAAAGLTAGDLARIHMIQSSYERSNAMNMIALGALLARLDGISEPPGSATETASEEEPVAGEMPLLLTLDAMDADVRALIQDLNRIGGRDEILASMYRHLAHWPPYLALVHVLIAPIAADGRLEPIITGVITEGRQRAARVANGLAQPTTALPDTAQSDIRAALSQFINEPIGKMIAIVPLIQRALPSPSKS
ncbi:MAG: hypothetical protein HN732_22680 [Rhodospirillaceae bacterium]|nr:hypothetical protein [Rhodospirillaceae bacterium]